MRTAALIAALFFPAAALAQTPPLTWNAPRACPSRAAVLQRATQAGLDPRADGTWTAEATVHRAAAGPWRLEMVIHAHGDDVPQRRSAATCAALAQLAAVDLALVVNAHVEPPPTPPPPPPAVTVVPRSVAPAAPPSIVPEAPARPTPRAWRVLLSAAAVTELRLLPMLNLGASVGVGASWAQARVELRGQWYPEVELAVPEAALRLGARPGAVGYVSLGQLSARGCGRLGASRLSVDLCGGVEGGWMSLRPTERLNGAVAGRFPWAGFLAGAEVSIRTWPALALTVGGDAGVLVVQGPSITVVNLGTVFDPTWWHATLRLGVTLAL